jgi:hypothetical protein
MSKSASTSAVKWAQRAGGASADYKAGAMNTTKDQAQSAIAAKELYKLGVTNAIARGSYEKGLGKSGKAGWLNGIDQKGEANYQTGVMSEGARNKYATESARFDGARNAASSLPRGAKGSQANLARVAAVANALHAIKIA